MVLGGLRPHFCAPSVQDLQLTGQRVTGKAQTGCQAVPRPYLYPFHVLLEQAPGPARVDAKGWVDEVQVTSAGIFLSSSQAL